MQGAKFNKNENRGGKPGFAYKMGAKPAKSKNGTIWFQTLNASLNILQ